MPPHQASRVHPHALATVVLVVGLLATWFAYAPGLSGSLHFDDYPNLQGLATVHDPASAFQFVATGTSGPLGRPLALASFVPQAYAWPSAPEVFLRTNIFIHLLNGVLVTWFLYLLGRARRQDERTAALVAVGVGAIWMLMPLLASSSLFIVQRMTTLSAVFMLFGAIAYMYARQAIPLHPVAALLGMTLAVVGGASLGVLAKENGVLLFLFILAMETTLLNRPSNVSHRVWRTWFGAVLIAPLIVLAYYLISVLPYHDVIVLRRGFNGIERLITQAEILWKYLYLAFLPDMPSLGPFHDDYPVQRNFLNVLTLLSIIGWVAVVAAAIALRKNAPLFTFAVAWFLAGHFLESTTLSLELYFEHRNYLPLVGPVYALVASMAHLSRPWLRLAVFFITAYAALLGSILYSTTLLWGSPALAAEMWHIYKPNSMRAVHQLTREIERQGHPFASRRLLQRFVESDPMERNFHLQILTLSCLLEPDKDLSEMIFSLEETLLIADFNHSVAPAFQRLYELVNNGRCRQVDQEIIYRLGQSLLQNPGFNLPIIRHNIHTVLARIGIDNRDFGLTLMHMEHALNSYPNPDTLLLTIGLLNSGGRLDVSWKIFSEAKARRLPRNPIQALQWKHGLDRIEDVLLSAEAANGVAIDQNID